MDVVWLGPSLASGVVPVGPRTRCWEGQVPRLRAVTQAPFRTPHGPAQPSVFGTLGAGARPASAGLYAPHPCLAQVTHLALWEAPRGEG